MKAKGPAATDHQLGHKREPTPVLRFPQYRKSGNWETKALHQIATLHKGRGISKAEISTEGSQRCIRYGELYTIYGEVIREVVSATHLPASGLFLSKKNDVIIPSSGETKIDIATASCVVHDGIALGSDLNIVRTSEDGIFLSYYLNGALKNTIAKLAQGDAVVHLHQSQLEQLSIPLPSYREQLKIADCLASIDEMIGAEGRKLVALKAYKKGLMQQLFPAEGETIPRLRFPGFRNAAEWGIKPLSELAKNLDNRRVPVTESNRAKGLIPYYGASGVVDYVSEFIFDEELLCVSEDGANLVARTSPIAFSVSGRSWVNNHAHVLSFKRREAQQIVQEYLNSMSLEDFLTGMAQPKLNRAMLDVIPIPSPQDKNEEQKVAGCLSSVNELITTQTQKINTLKAHKKGLMQQLFPVLDEVQK